MWIIIPLTRLLNTLQVIIVIVIVIMIILMLPLLLRHQGILITRTLPQQHIIIIIRSIIITHQILCSISQ